MLTIFSLLISCADKKEANRLSQENEKLKSEIEQLKKEIYSAKASANTVNFLASQLKGVKARIITNYGNIEIEFYPETAPITVASFVIRAESGFYDGTQFHRIIPGFMIQGGDPNSKDNDPYNDGMGGPVFNTPHEFNTIEHLPGVVSMARTSNKAAGAGSQFFIMHGTSPQLNQEYTAFGRVIHGMDLVEKIANVPTNKKDPRLRDHPLKPVIIKHVEVFRE
jgi:peptidyl-prolyl cis-trans isomerase B (cyclophilin B)